MPDELRLRTVRLEYPRPDDMTGGVFRPTRKRDSETWLSILEQTLSTDFKDYTIEVSQVADGVVTVAIVVFSNVEDATLFRLQHSR
jgi:hypothetical protein